MAEALSVSKASINYSRVVYVVSTVAYQDYQD